MKKSKLTKIILGSAIIILAFILFWHLFWSVREKQAIRFLQKAENFSGARKALNLKKALILDPENFRAHAVLADFYLEKGKLDSAQKEYQKAYQLFPDDEFAKKIVSIFVAGGKTEEARTFLSKTQRLPAWLLALDFYKGNTNSKDLVSAAKEASFFLTSVLLLAAKGETEVALELLADLSDQDFFLEEIKRSIENIDSKDWLTRNLMLAKTALDFNPLLSRILVKQILDEDVLVRDAWLLEAELNFSDKFFDLALEDIDNALAIDPISREARLGRIKVDLAKVILRALIKIWNKQKPLILTKRPLDR